MAIGHGDSKITGEQSPVSSKLSAARHINSGGVGECIYRCGNISKTSVLMAWPNSARIAWPNGFCDDKRRE